MAVAAKTNKGEVYSKKVLSLYNGGQSLQQISESFNVSINSVERTLKSKGVNLERDLDKATGIKKSKSPAKKGSVNAKQTEVAIEVKIPEEKPQEEEIRPTVVISKNGKEETIKYSSKYDGFKNEDQFNEILNIMVTNDRFNMKEIETKYGVPYSSLRKIKEDLGLVSHRGKRNKNVDHGVDEESIEEAEKDANVAANFEKVKNTTTHESEETDKKNVVKVHVNDAFKATIEESEKEKEDSQEAKENAISDNDLVTYIYPGKYRDTLKCGLVRDRHDMPACIRQYVYNRIEDYDILSFSKLDSIASAFILNNVKIKDGMSCKKLEVYVTGLQSALGSLIKMCNIHKVNLTLCHYDPISHKYAKQPIFTDFPMYQNDLIEFEKVEKIFLHYGMTEDELMNKEFIAVEKTINDHGREFKILNTFVEADKDKAFKFYCEKMMEPSSDPEKIYYSFYKAKINNGNLITTEFIARTYRSEI